jgi:hypothetical protein
LGEFHAMKAKLALLGIGIAVALCGFWIGSYRARQEWEKKMEWALQDQNHTANRGRAATAVAVLGRLGEGKQSEARDKLEMQLDLGICGMVFYVSNYSRRLDSVDAMVIEQARSYRSRQPWTNSLRPDLAEVVQRAFNKAD